MTDAKAYATVTAAYWGFTLTDGALRMLVLLHFHGLGYSPFDIAMLFLLYEFMGIVTNLFGGWLGTLKGLRVTLFAGLILQIFALVSLSFVDAGWAVGFSVVYVMVVQALSGVAKDLTKMSSKSAVKLVAGNDGSTLFKWVAVLTGSKNALKGVGFFLGGLLLSLFGYQGALLVMAGGLALVLVGSFAVLTQELGKAKKKVKVAHLFSKKREINLLSAARVFLFCARDVWFVVGVPLFLTAQLGWSFTSVGGFMAAWVIGYGMVQAVAPRFFENSEMQSTGAKKARNWAFGLAVIPLFLAYGAGWAPEPAWVLVGGLALFGVVFAINSAVHSYLILAYAREDGVALDVGFYYMANAVGRLAGTLLSGLVYQYGGLSACLWVSALLVLMSAVFASVLARPSDASSAT